MLEKYAALQNRLGGRLILVKKRLSMASIVNQPSSIDESGLSAGGIIAEGFIEFVGPAAPGSQLQQLVSLV
jgi:hypothetical protein